MKSGIFLTSLGFVAVAALLVFYLDDGPTFVTASEDSNTNKGVNDISLRTVFHFKTIDETIDTFKVFKQTDGWSSYPAKFILEGEIDASKPHLHNALEKKGSGYYKNFGLDVYLEKNDDVYRQFTYDSCNIVDYKTDTVYSPEKAYNKITQFAYVENFTIECLKFNQQAIDYDNMKKQEKQALESSRTIVVKNPTWKENKLDSSVGWEDVYPYPYNHSER